MTRGAGRTQRRVQGSLHPAGFDPGDFLPRQIDLDRSARNSAARFLKLSIFRLGAAVGHGGDRFGRVVGCGFEN
jgi:hypothetical protein